MNPRPSTPSFRFGLRWKVGALIAVVATAVVLFLVTSFGLQMRRLAVGDLDKLGGAVSTQLASAVAFAVFSRDTVGLDNAAQALADGLPEVAYVAIRSADGELLTQVRARDLPSAFKLSARSEAGPLQAGPLELQRFVAPVTFADKARPAVSESVDPMDLVLAGGTPEPAPGPSAGSGGSKSVGEVEVAFRMDPLKRELSSIFWSATLLGLLVLAVGVAAAVLAARFVTIPLERLAQAATRVAAGDLRQEITLHSNDEIGTVADSFQSMLQALRAMMEDLRAAAKDIDREAATVFATATEQSAMANQQSSAITETSATVTEIAETSRQAAQHADGVIDVTEKSEQLSREGQRAVEDSVVAMENLGEQVKLIAASITELTERTLQIGDIMSTVKDLAEQSHMLALNASIEAARAGEHGRGFAVVAMEMRNLAEQSKVAAGQVRAIVAEVHRGTRSAVTTTEEGSKRAHDTMALARTAGKSIVGLAEVIRDSAQSARQIAGNTRQQTVGVDQIHVAITQLQNSMTETLAGTRGIETVASSLTTLSSRLSELTNRYQV